MESIAALEFVYLIFLFTIMKLLIFFSFLFLISVFGCKNSQPTTPLQTGDLKGTVGLIDLHGNEISDRSGVFVQVEGTGFSALSDSAGNWIIHNLPTQTYSVSFSKTNYGTVRNTSFSYIGGGTVSYGARVYLYQPVNFTITLDSVSAVFDSPDHWNNYGYLSGHISGAVLDSAIVQAYVFFGTSPNITFGDTSTWFGGLLWDNSRPIPLIKKGKDFFFETKNWEICGPEGWQKSGMTIYLQGFAMTMKYSPKYYDVMTDKWIYPNPPPSSNIMSVKIP
jgi:hypothetical protein